MGAERCVSPVWKATERRGADCDDAWSDLLTGQVQFPSGALEAERVRWTAVNPSDFSTVTAFKAGLTATGQKHLDETTWYNALKDKLGVSSFSDLRTATKPAMGI